MAGGGTESVSTLSGPQRRVARETSRQILAGLQGQGATPYEGDLVAGLIPEMGLVRDQAMKGMEGFGTDQSEISAILDMIQGKLAQPGSTKTMTDMFQKSIANPAYQMFQDQTMPQLAQQFSGLGQTFSSTRQNVTGRALESLNRDLSSQFSQLAWQDQNTRMQLGERAREAGIGFAMQKALQPFQKAQAFSQTMAPFQAYEDAMARAQYGEFQRTADENNPFMQYALNFTGQNHVQNVAGGDGWGAAAGAGIGLAASMFTGPAAPWVFAGTQAATAGATAASGSGG